MSASMNAATALVEPTAPVAEGEAAKKIEGKSPWRLGYERLRRDRAAMISVAVILLIVLAAIFAPVIAAIIGHGPNEQFPAPIGVNAQGQPLGPSTRFWLGTDTLGRDVLVRIVYGARISLIVGFVATIITVVIGAAAGLAAAYFGGLTDSLLARLMDWLLAIPFLLLAISLVSVIGAGLTVLIIVIGFLGWASVGRIVRGQVLTIKEKEYVEAARSLGAGIPPPTADWGQMIADSQSVYQYGAWWYLVFPSLALLITTLAFNIFGDGVRDAFDPRGDQLFV
jgi:ABC-type dipeptide/oligopeptide/nickel transport system permease subunit